MNKSEQTNELFTALAKAQAEIEGAVKDSTNPHFKSRYASLANVMEACKVPLSKNGLSVMQLPDSDDPHVVAMITVLGHSSGQWISSRLVMNPTKFDPQGIGAAITYCRRYALAAIVGVCPDEDDDANSASMAPQTTESPTLGRVIKLLEANDEVGMYALSKEDDHAFKSAFGRLNTKQKAACRELEQKGSSMVIDWAEYLRAAKDSNDPDDAQAFLAGITDATQKRLLWAALDTETQHWIKSLKAVA